MDVSDQLHDLELELRCFFFKFGLCTFVLKKLGFVKSESV